MDRVPTATAPRAFDLLAEPASAICNLDCPYIRATVREFKTFFDH